MKIVRVEHKIDGKGIFRSSTKKKETCRFSKIPNCIRLYLRHTQKFPLPSKDKGINREPLIDEFCAFKSIDDLQMWLENNELRNLIKIGFKVFVHTIHKKKCVIGEYQVLFKKTDVTATTDITELFI